MYKAAEIHCIRFLKFIYYNINIYAALVNSEAEVVILFHVMYVMSVDTGT